MKKGKTLRDYEKMSDADIWSELSPFNIKVDIGGYDFYLVRPDPERKGKQIQVGRIEWRTTPKHKFTAYLAGANWSYQCRELTDAIGWLGRNHLADMGEAIKLK